MNLVILDDAETEFKDAIFYYSGIQNKLADRFKEEISCSLQWIKTNPEIPHLRPIGYRRVNLRVFPYYIAYMIQPSSHTHCHPRTWALR